jgi:ketosteroid isomerase-like protein
MEPLDVLHAFAACLAGGDAAGAAALFAKDATYDEPPAAHFVGRDAIDGFISDFAAHHTAASFTITRSLASADGSLLAAEWRWAYSRLDGTRRTFEGISFVTLRGGLITSWRGFSGPVTASDISG